MPTIIIKSSQFGAAIKTARSLQKITQADLAKQAGVSRNTIAKIEHGGGSLLVFWSLLDTLNLKLTARQLPQGENIGQRLAILRKRRGISQAALASLAGVSQPSIWRLETDNGARLAILERIFIALGIERRLAPASQADSFFVQAGTSSACVSWNTPPHLLSALYGVVGGQFDLDPCSPTANRRHAPVRAKMHFSETDNGLELDWFGTVFVNPPYGREISQWTHKARTEFAAGNAQTIIALLPARTDTGWWHNDIADSAAIWFLRGRLAFGDGKAPAPFASALVGWGLDGAMATRLGDAFSSSWRVPVCS